MSHHQPLRKIIYCHLTQFPAGSRGNKMRRRLINKYFFNTSTTTRRTDAINVSSFSSFYTDTKLHDASRFLSHSSKWDAVVIGGGHNGLTAAAYLAKSGLQVAVLEKRHVLGGAAVTEEIVPGFKFSRCSYVQSLLRPSIIRELELKRHGMKLLERNPSSFTPCLDGRYLILGSDEDANCKEISKFSSRDAVAYPKYEKQLKKFCESLDVLLDTIPPELQQEKSSSSSLIDTVSDKFQKSLYWYRILRKALQFEQREMVEFVELLVAPASKVLNNWFEGDVLKATLATDAVIGSMGSPSTPGSGYVLLHNVMGETEGRPGIWSYVEGGMGSVSTSIGKAAYEAGAKIFTNAVVKTLTLDEASGRVNGVLLEDGTHIQASTILSNATAYLTFMEMTPSGALPDDFLQVIKNLDYSSGSTKINLAVDELPQFECFQHVDNGFGPQHMGTIHIASESMEEIDVAHRDALKGIPSSRPFIEMTIPSVLDKTISPSGKHVINLFIQYTPYQLSMGSWDDSSFRELFARRCFSVIDEYAPGFSSSIIGYDMLAPPDLEKQFSLTGGNIFHGAMGLDSLFLMRPTKGWSNYRTPIRGLYLCGSGAHPGGGVMGAPGRNAAHAVLEDLRKS